MFSSNLERQKFILFCCGIILASGGEAAVFLDLFLKYYLTDAQHGFFSQVAFSIFVQVTIIVGFTQNWVQKNMELEIKDYVESSNRSVENKNTQLQYMERELLREQL